MNLPTLASAVWLTILSTAYTYELLTSRTEFAIPVNSSFRFRALGGLAFTLLTLFLILA